MTVSTYERATIDTRGLPDSYDPRMFYEYSMLRHSENARGLDALLYKLMPWTLVRSFAFAIDPLHQYKTSLGRITPSSRVRKKRTVSVLTGSSGWYGSQRSETWSTISNYGGLNQNSSFMVLTALDVQEWPRVAIHQTVPFDETKDTTRRTRIMGSELGEFEKFKSQIRSTPRSYTGVNDSEAVTTFPPPTRPQKKRSATVFDRHFSPQGAVLSAGVSDTLRSDAEVTAQELISKNIVSMLKNVSPLRRDYTLLRNVVELRDMPRSIVSLQQTLLDLVRLGKSLNVRNAPKIVHDLKVSLRHVPEQYLSYSFGWRQLWQDINRLVIEPDRIARKMNFLIKRNGLDTTHRTTRDYPLPDLVSTSGFAYEFGNSEQDISTKHKVSRSAQLRLVVNSKFEFPPADLPSFRRNHFLRQLGVAPTPTDLYNLVPWSWLLDWFTGLGNYVEIIDTINRDESLINWGMVTCVLKGTLESNFKSNLRTTHKVTWDGALIKDEVRLTPLTHSSAYDYEYQKRIDVCNAIPRVKTIANLGSLSLYQQSILGALITQRTKLSR